MRSKYLSEEAVRALLRHAIEEGGGQSALARKWGVSQTYIGQTARGLQRPGKKICRNLGVTRVDSEPLYYTEST